MAIPKKLVAKKKSFKNYIMYEGGWKRIAKLSVGAGVCIFGAFSFLRFYNISKKSQLYSDGILLQKSGVIGSELSPMYYNEKRQEDEKVKCRVDTSKKLSFGETYWNKSILQWKNKTLFKKCDCIINQIGNPYIHS